MSHKLLFSLLFVVMTLSVKAQTLKVSYRQTKDISSQLESIPERIRDMVREKIGKPVNYELISSNGVSVYQKASSDKGNIIFKNHVDSKMIQKVDLLGENYLIEEELKQLDWVFHNETKKIGNFECKKATKGDKLTVWYTQELPITDGPGKYFIPSALILKMIVDKTTTIVTDMELTEDSTVLNPPTKGKKISREAYEKLRDEKFESLQFSGGQTFRM